MDRLRLSQVINWLTVTVGVGVIAELLHQSAPQFFLDHSSLVGDFIAWRWSTLTLLGVMLILAVLAYASINGDAVDLRGSRLRYEDGPEVSVDSDGVRWVAVGTRTWDDGVERPEVEERCRDHAVRLLHVTP